jgi:hypothetical protein
MECKIFIQKYKNILRKINDNITDLKVNSDDPLVSSYILSDLKVLEKQIKSIKNFNELLKKCIN